MNDLLDEISGEVELDSRLPDPATEIAARLARLKGQDEGKQQTGTNFNYLIIQNCVRSIVHRFTTFLGFEATSEHMGHDLYMKLQNSKFQ